MNKKYFIGAFTFLAMLVLIYNASASCIMPGNVEEEFARADAVFEGTVMKVEEFDEMNNLVNFYLSVPIWKGDEFMSDFYRDKDGWDDDYAGAPIFTLDIIVPKTDRVSVGYDYEVDKNYIVYAYDSDGDGQLETNLCTRTNLNVEDVEKERDELEILYSLNFGGAVKGEIKIVDEVPTENDDYDLMAAEIKGDYLETIVNYGGGCEEHEFILFVYDGILPDSERDYEQKNVYLVHDNNGDSCELAVNEKIVFDLTPLKEQFEVCPLCTDCGEP